MRCMDDIVEEIPYITFSPLEYRRHEYRVLSIYAAYLIISLNGKLVFVQLTF